MDFLNTKPESAAAREAKNQMALSGEIDRVFKAVLSSNEPDAIHALLVGLVHKSVDVAETHLLAGRSAAEFSETGQS